MHADSDCNNTDWPHCQGPCRIPACDETWLRAVISRSTKSGLAQRIFVRNLDEFAEELCRAHFCVWEVPGLQVSGCQDRLEDIRAGSEVLLLIPDSSTAPYQSFLFSSTLFSASSWLSQPRGGVSLTSLICSHPFSLSFACCHPVRDTEQPFCSGPSRAGAPGPALSRQPAPLQPPARLSRVAELLPC